MSTTVGVDSFSLAEKTADRLTDSLPIEITPKDVQNNPEFTKLLTALSQRVTPSGLNTQVQKDLTQAEEELRHEKHRWLLHDILYKELEELLMSYEIQSQDTSMSPDNKQFYTILQECLTFAEVGDYLHCCPDPGSKVTLLGLTPESIKEENPYQQHLPYIQQRLIPQIEERLAKKCDNLVNFNDTENDSDSGFNMANATQLPAVIEADKRKLADEKIQLQKDKKNKDKQFRLYYQTLSESLELLEKLIVKYRLKNQAEHDSITTEWLAAKCDGLCLKIRLIELQILCDTYSVEIVKALQKIRDHLDVATVECKKKHDHVSKALNTYESVGMGFDDLVKEYRRLKEEVENKQWALSELQDSVDSKD